MGDWEWGLCVVLFCNQYHSFLAALQRHDLPLFTDGSAVFGSDNLAIKGSPKGLQRRLQETRSINRNNRGARFSSARLLGACGKFSVC